MVIPSTMTKKIAVNQAVSRVWDIEGFPAYFFANDKQLYRFDSQGRIQKNKRIMLRYTAGYVLKSRFYSLSQLRSRLRRHVPTDHPADF